MEKRVLIVDDDLSSRMLLAEFLSDEGYQVDTAGDCSSAGALACDRTYQFAILDMNLPDGTGPGLLHSIRSKSPEVRALLLTGEDRRDAEDKCGADIELFDEVVSKPFSLVDIARMLQELSD